MMPAAIAKIKDTIRPAGISPVCNLLPNLPESAQVQVLAVLSGYPKEAVLPAVLEAAKRPESLVEVEVYGTAAK